MNCPNCGHETHGTFCTNCGARVPQAPEKEDARPPAAPVDPGATSAINRADLQGFRPAPPPESLGDTAAFDPGDWDKFRQPPVAESPARQDDLVSVGGRSTAMVGGGVGTMLAPDSVGVMTQPFTHPTQVEIPYPQNPGRFWAIPLIGFLAKAVVLIPHIIVLYVLGLIVGVLQLFLWIPVLATGRYPASAANLVGGTMRWWTRMAAFGYGLTDQYPPFSLGSNDDPSYPVRVMYQTPVQSKRFWAIPLIGYLAKYIILIPHLIILYAVGLVVGVLQLVIWVPVLFTGTYPSWGYELVSGYLRWANRVGSFFLGLNDQYPPFQLGR